MNYVCKGFSENFDAEVKIYTYFSNRRRGTLIKEVTLWDIKQVFLLFFLIIYLQNKINKLNSLSHISPQKNKSVDTAVKVLIIDNILNDWKNF